MEEAAATAMRGLVNSLVYTLFPLIKRVEALEAHTRSLRGLPPTQELVGRLGSAWCADCRAEWVHRDVVEDEVACNGPWDACGCGQRCEECCGSNPQSNEPPFSWSVSCRPSQRAYYFNHLEVHSDWEPTMGIKG